MNITKKMTQEQVINELKLRKKVDELLKKPKADHRHNWKDGKRVRIFGARYHVHCAIKGCNEFKVLT